VLEGWEGCAIGVVHNYSMVSVLALLIVPIAGRRISMNAAVRVDLGSRSVGSSNRGTLQTGLLGGVR
jgi:hypothetical protein